MHGGVVAYAITGGSQVGYVQGQRSTLTHDVLTALAECFFSAVLGQNLAERSRPTQALVWLVLAAVRAVKLRVGWRALWQYFDGIWYLMPCHATSVARPRASAEAPQNWL